MATKYQIIEHVRPKTLLCTKCGLWKLDKEFSAFHHVKSRRRRQYWCRECTRLSVNDRVKNRAEARKWERMWQKHLERHLAKIS